MESVLIEASVQQRSPIRTTGRESCNEPGASQNRVRQGRSRPPDHPHPRGLHPAGGRIGCVSVLP